MFFLNILHKGFYKKKRIIYKRKEYTLLMFKKIKAGIYSEKNPVTKELLDSAETIYVFEEHQRTWIAKHFPKEYMQKQILNLDIPDIYAYNQESLIQKIHESMR